jgi:hypothetical protein
MSHNPNDKDSKGKERKRSREENPDFQLDDLDDEIIDLLDPLEGEGAEPDDSSALDQILDEDRDLSFEDFDVEMELGEDETSEAAAGETAGEIAEDDLFSDEALAELFASHESEVAKLLEEAGGSPAEDERVPSAEAAPVSEEELPEDLFADLEREAEGVGELEESAEAAPVSEEELPEDLFADLEMETEGAGELEESAEAAPVSEEELPEDLFADLEREAEGVGELEESAEATPVVEEEVTAQDASDFEKELDSVIDETVEAASALAVEEEPKDVAADFEGEPEEGSQMDISEEITPAAAEELAALVSGQVEEVVTRLVEERLPAIVERLVAQEIEKIKSSLESGE